MRPKDVLPLLRAQPFAPFRMHLSDGSAHDVTHPGLAIVERSKVIVGAPGPKGPDGPVERSIFCALMHITRLESINGATRSQ